MNAFKKLSNEKVLDINSNWFWDVAYNTLPWLDILFYFLDDMLSTSWATSFTKKQKSIMHTKNS